MIRPRTSFFALSSAALAALLLTGCGTGLAPVSTGPVATPIAASTQPNGIVMGGQQPVVGIALQLYAVGTSGYGSAGTPLFTTPPLTSSTGNFTFPAFTCPSPNTLVFLVGTGGQPIAGNGSTPAVTNNNLALMAGLGACSGAASQFINMNEVTTVATVWSLAPFMTGPTNIGAPVSNALGLQNAFAAINQVVNLSTGVVSGPALPAGATLPLAEINALGDILQNCVNSGGGSASDTTTTCGKLFSLTTAATAPTDTITAALNIAKNPAQNVAQLNNLQSSSPAFSPAINVNAPPSDWTIAITYQGGGLSAPRGVATDQAGNVWVANSGNSSVSLFNASGAALSGTNGITAGGISMPYAVAIDPSGNAWVANSGNNTVTELNPNGTTGTSFSGNGLNAPRSIAVDATGNVFVGNSAGTAGVSGFTNSGVALAGSPFNTGSGTAASAVAISPK